MALKKTQAKEDSNIQESLQQKSARLRNDYLEIQKQVIEVRKQEFEEFQNKVHALQEQYGFSIETQYTTRHDGIQTSYYFVDLQKILNA